MLTQHVLPHVFNNIRSAECAEFSSIVIGNYYLLQTIAFCFSVTNNSSCEVNYKLLGTMFENCNHYIVCTTNLAVQ